MIECPIIRNAGGRAQDAIRSILVLDTVVTMGEVIVIHHTGTTALLPSPLPLFHLEH
jgi:carbonic anhydrase